MITPSAHYTTRQLAYLQAMGLDVYAPVAAPEGPSAPEQHTSTPVVAAEQVTARAKCEPTQGTEEGAGDTMNLEALATIVSNCTRCRLHQTRKQTVFGVGNPNANWLLIGEGPGAREDALGEPFVGPAGKLLDRMLAAVGSNRQQVYIANIVKCRPPGNRNPKPDEAQACREYLEGQIQQINPSLILALGKVAAHALLGTEGPMGRLRGRSHSMPGHPNIAVIPTWHPAYLLREPARKREAWEDLKRAVALGPP